MNLDVEKTGLIDISLEDDYLIDKRFDNSSVDLRLSVAFETQMELVSDLKPRARVDIHDRIHYLADKETQTYGDSARNSLAWDNAFFTSPGFLELEELCLVNRGFKDPQRQSVCGDLQSTRRKVCRKRNAGHKSRVAVECRQSTRSLVRSKLASPTKMAIQDSQRQIMTTRRSEAVSGATYKSPVTQGTIKKKEYLLKSSKATGQNRFSMAHNKKATLQEVSRNRTPERLGSVASSLPFLPSTAIDTSIELSPYGSKDNAVQTVNLTKSQGSKGECFPGFHSPFGVDSRNTDVGEPSPQGTQGYAYTNASYTSSTGGHRNKQISHQPYIKQVNPGRESQRQNATRGTKNPLSANSQKSEVRTVDESSLLSPEADINSDEKLFTNASTSVHTPTHELKHRPHDVKIVNPRGTPPILHERKVQTQIKTDKYHENTEINSHGQDGIKPTNHHIIIKTDTLGKEKENMLPCEDNVVELESKKRSPLPHRLGKKGPPIPGKIFGSSRKRSIAAQQTTRQNNESPINSRKDFSTKNSPLQRSSIF